SLLPLGEGGPKGRMRVTLLPSPAASRHHLPKGEGPRENRVQLGFQAIRQKQVLRAASFFCLIVRAKALMVLPRSNLLRIVFEKDGRSPGFSQLYPRRFSRAR